MHKFTSSAVKEDNLWQKMPHKVSKGTEVEWWIGLLLIKSSSCFPSTIQKSVLFEKLSTRRKVCGEGAHKLQLSLIKTTCNNHQKNTE
jgi:hypothetical protein